MISFAERGTEKDCTYMLEIRAIEQGILASVLTACGADPKAISGDVLRKAAASLRQWKNRE